MSPGCEGEPFSMSCVPKIVLGGKIAQWWQPLPVTRRIPFAKAPIAQGFDRDQHNLWDTTFSMSLGYEGGPFSMSSG